METLGGSWRPWVARFLPTLVMSYPKFEIMRNGMFLGDEEVSSNIS